MKVDFRVCTWAKSRGAVAIEDEVSGMQSSIWSQRNNDPNRFAALDRPKAGREGVLNLFLDHSLK
jgi:hypothetical protein